MHNGHIRLGLLVALALVLAEYDQLVIGDIEQQRFDSRHLVNVRPRTTERVPIITGHMEGPRTITRMPNIGRQRERPRITTSMPLAYVHNQYVGNISQLVPQNQSNLVTGPPIQPTPSKPTRSAWLEKLNLTLSDSYLRSKELAEKNWNVTYNSTWVYKDLIPGISNELGWYGPTRTTTTEQPWTQVNKQLLTRFVSETIMRRIPGVIERPVPWNGTGRATLIGGVNMTCGTQGSALTVTNEDDGSPVWACFNVALRIKQIKEWHERNRTRKPANGTRRRTSRDPRTQAPTMPQIIITSKPTEMMSTTPPPIVDSTTDRPVTEMMSTTPPPIVDSTTNKPVTEMPTERKRSKGPGVYDPDIHDISIKASHEGLEEHFAHCPSILDQPFFVFDELRNKNITVCMKKKKAQTRVGLTGTIKKKVHKWRCQRKCKKGCDDVVCMIRTTTKPGPIIDNEDVNIDPKPDPEIDPNPDSDIDLDSESEPEPKPKPKPNPKPNPNPNPNPNPDPMKPDPKPDPNLEPKPEPIPNPGPEPEPQPIIGPLPFKRRRTNNHRDDIVSRRERQVELVSSDNKRNDIGGARRRLVDSKDLSNSQLLKRLVTITEFSALTMCSDAVPEVRKTGHSDPWRPLDAVVKLLDWVATLISDDSNTNVAEEDQNEGSAGAEYLDDKSERPPEERWDLTLEQILHKVLNAIDLVVEQVSKFAKLTNNPSNHARHGDRCFLRSVGNIQDAIDLILEQIKKLLEQFTDYLGRTPAKHKMQTKSLTMGQSVIELFEKVYANQKQINDLGSNVTCVTNQEDISPRKTNSGRTRRDADIVDDSENSLDRWRSMAVDDEDEHITGNYKMKLPLTKRGRANRGLFENFPPPCDCDTMDFCCT